MDNRSLKPVEKVSISREEMLNFIRQGTQMGRQGILNVLQKTEDGPFRKELHRQLSEYEELYKEADAALKQRGGRAENISPMARMSSKMMTAMKTWKDPSVSHMAEMMLQGNTMGISGTMRKKREYETAGAGDPIVHGLTEKFLKTEEQNAENMKTFL